MVIHRDRYFRGEEKCALTAWPEKIGAVVFLVEALKRAPLASTHPIKGGTSDL
jgi:hypothetical protein